MILIADGGSTKTHWCAISKDFNSREFFSEGYNPYFVNGDYIERSLKSSIPADLLTDRVEKLYFYGAGVHNRQKALVLEKAFGKVFCSADFFIANDLLAVCRALLGDQTGFAAILGTGTNTCIYDGQNITHQISSAAYILGDEGSGCHIGKKLLTDYLRGYLPAAVKTAFDTKYQLSADEIRNRIYSQALANRFCASFSQFVCEQIDNEYMLNIVRSSFDEFFRQLVSRYPDYRSYRFNSVGSVGFYFKETLVQTAGKYGMEAGTIVKSPVPGLLKYHKKSVFGPVL